MQRSLINHLIRAVLGCLAAAIGVALLGIVLLRWLPPPTSAFMLQSEVKPVHYEWVPMSRIAATAGQAVIASEDQKFRTHHGFDLEAMQKAYENNQKARHRRRGASTISQQTAKNLFLWPQGGYARKAIEAGLTSLMELLWGKDRILEMYLNIAEFGPGIYGVEAASRAYFAKPAVKLTPEESARLAAVLPNPRKWSAKNPGPYVQQRVSWILGQMGYGSRNAPAEEPEPPSLMFPAKADAKADAPADVEVPDDNEPADQPPAPVSPVTDTSADAAQSAP